jgi:hypothetical protein
VENGKLYILGGGWGTLYVKELPVTYPLQIATHFDLPIDLVSERIDVEFRVGLDSEVEPANLDTTSMALIPPGAADPEGTHSEIVAILGAQLEFRREGRYRAELVHNGESFAQLSFRVRLAPDLPELAATTDLQRSIST